jgi:hypothetical protein
MMLDEYATWAAGHAGVPEGRAALETAPPVRERGR